jgi:hypothetical protein
LFFVQLRIAQSQVAIKIIQIIRTSSTVGGAKTEIIVNDPQMYQYTFRRIADVKSEQSCQPAAEWAAVKCGVVHTGSNP